MDGYTEITPKEFDSKVVKLIGFDWMLITAGNLEHYNTMTAAWGGLGFLWNMPVSFIFVRPQRYTYEFTEKNNDFTLTFFNPEKHRKMLNYCGRFSGRDVDKAKENGLTVAETADANVFFSEADIVMECEKLYVDDLKGENFLHPELDVKIYKTKDYHRMYIARIKHIWQKK